MKAIQNASQLDRELHTWKALSSMKEGEDTWKQFDNLLLNFSQNMGTLVLMPNFLPAVKKYSNFVSNCIMTERSKLCGTACEFLISMAQALKFDFEPYAELFVPCLLKLCQRANKVFITRGSTTMSTIISICGIPFVTGLLVEGMQSPHKIYRALVAEFTSAIIQYNSQDLLLCRLTEFEYIIRQGLTDADSSTREKARLAFTLYKSKMPNECARFIDTIPPSAMKGFNSSMSSSSYIVKTVDSIRVPEKNAQTPIETPVKEASNQRSAETASTTARVMATMFTSSNILDKLKTVTSKEESTVSSVNDKKDHKSRAQLIGNVLAHAKFDKAPSIASKSIPESFSEPMATPRRPRLLGPVQRLNINKGEENNNCVSIKSPPPVNIAAPVEKDESLEIQKPRTEIKTNVLIKDRPQNYTNVPADVIGIHESSEIKVCKHSSTSKVAHEDDYKSQKTECFHATADKNVEINTDNIDYYAIFLDLKKPEWSIRMDAYQKIYNSIDSLLLTQSNFQLKFMDACLVGLDDSHFRNVKMVLQTWFDLLNNHPPEITAIYHQTLMQKCLAIAEASQNRNRLGIREMALDIFALLKSQLSVIEFINQMFAILNIPEYLNSVRVCQGAVINILEVVEPVKYDYFSKLSVFRMALARLCSCTTEADKTFMKQMSKLILLMHSTSPNLFFEAISHLSVGDKAKVRLLAGKEISNYKDLEANAANVKKSSKVRSQSSVKSSDQKNSISRLPIRLTSIHSTSSSKGSALPVKAVSHLNSKSAINPTNPHRFQKHQSELAKEFEFHPESTSELSVYPVENNMEFRSPHSLLAAEIEHFPQSTENSTKFSAEPNPSNEIDHNIECQASDESKHEGKMCEIEVRELFKGNFAESSHELMPSTENRIAMASHEECMTLIENAATAPNCHSATIENDIFVSVEMGDIHEDLTPFKEIPLEEDNGYTSVISRDMIENEEYIGLKQETPCAYKEIIPVAASSDIHEFDDNAELDQSTECISSMKEVINKSLYKDNSLSLERDDIGTKPFETESLQIVVSDGLAHKLLTNIETDDFQSALPAVWDFVDSCIENAIELCQASKTLNFEEMTKSQKIDLLDTIETSATEDFGQIIKNLIKGSMDMDAEIALKSRKVLVNVAKSSYNENPDVYESKFLKPLSKQIIDNCPNYQMLGFVLAAKFQAAKLPFSIVFE